MRAQGWAEAEKAKAQRKPAAMREHEQIFGQAPSLVTRIRYRGNCPVTVHESMVTSVHKRMEPRRSPLGASVDVTEARNRRLGTVILLIY